MASGSLRAFYVAKGGRDEGDALEDHLRARIDAGRSAWPALALSDEAFVEHLAAHGGEGLPPQAHGADLWIACACMKGVAGAAAAFERAYRPWMERAVRRVNPASVDEATQAALVSLLVSEPGKSQRIADYAGRAPLRSWLATVAANAALRLHRRIGDQAHDTLGGLANAAVEGEPELALAKARHGADLEAALREALDNLAQRQRVLLRLKHVKGWRLEQVATMYRVSRATAARMVAAAHEELLEGTKRVLRERLKLTPSELESLLAILQSGFHVSVARMLEAGAD